MKIQSAPAETNYKWAQDLWWDGACHWNKLLRSSASCDQQSLTSSSSVRAKFEPLSVCTVQTTRWPQIPLPVQIMINYALSTDYLIADMMEPKWFPPCPATAACSTSSRGWVATCGYPELVTRGKYQHLETGQQFVSQLPDSVHCHSIQCGLQC